MMKNIKLLSLLLAMLLIMSISCGCSNNDTIEPADNSNVKQEQNTNNQMPRESRESIADNSNVKQEQNTNNQMPRESRGFIGKVISMEGDSITVVLATEDLVPEQNVSERPTAQGVNVSKGGIGDRPKQFGGGAPGGQMDYSNMKFTGEEKTFHLSNKVTVTKEHDSDKEEVDLSELEVNSVIRFNTETDEDGNEEIILISIF